MAAKTQMPLSIKDYVLIAGLLMGLGGQQWQLADLRSRYDREVVPRSEHIQMNAITEERWRAIDQRLTAMQQDMKDMARELHDSRLPENRDRKN